MLCRYCSWPRAEHEERPDWGSLMVKCPTDGFLAFTERAFPEPTGERPMATASESELRKETPLYSGCLAYFPDAIAVVARLSKVGNDKHNPGEPLHWSRGKSADHADSLARHLVTHGTIDPETGLSHTAAVAWRALALLQTEIEAARKPTPKADDPARRKRVYIAGPISQGDLAHNINQATEAFVALTKAGFAPFCPHWSAYSKPARVAAGGVWCWATVCGNDTMTHEDWLGIDLPWVAASDALLRLPGESDGADREVAEANRLGIPYFETITGLCDHFGVPLPRAA